MKEQKEGLKTMDRRMKIITMLKRMLALTSMLVLLISCIPEALAAETALDIPNGSWGTWKKVSTKRMSFTFEVKNTNSSKTVRSFNVTYYTCDAYGYQNAQTETVTLTQKIKPYETVEVGPIYLSDPQNSCLVYVAITKVYYTNGTSETNSDPNYSYWILNEDDLMVDPSDITSSASRYSSPTATPKPSSGSTASASLTIPSGSRASLKRVSTRRYSIRFDVKNTHPSKTVTSYDISFYTCDAYGNQNSSVEKTTLTQKIKPYETITCPEIFLENAAYVYQAYFAVTRVRYSDGTVENVSSPSYKGWYWD